MSNSDGIRRRGANGRYLPGDGSTILAESRTEGGDGSAVRIIRPSRGVLAGRECLRPLPFAEWATSRLARLEHEYRDLALARSHLFAELGWGEHDPVTAERRLSRWRRENPLVALADIEDALTAATSPLFGELYPEAAIQLEAGDA